MLNRIKAWFKTRRSKPLDELLAVQFDDFGVRVRVIEDLDPAWNQAFTWDRVRRVCFEDGGMLSSDLIYVSLVDPEQIVTVPTEAQGGAEFFGAICNRGLFPEAIWRKAIGDTSGGLHCWPRDGLPASSEPSETPERAGPDGASQQSGDGGQPKR